MRSERCWMLSQAQEKRRGLNSVFVRENHCRVNTTALGSESPCPPPGRAELAATRRETPPRCR